MKKLIVRVIHKNVEYSSNDMPCNEKEEADIRKLIANAANGELSNLHFVSGNREIYFSKQILLESIIEIDEIK